ncbi:MAG: hypothetical protein WBR18_00420 [Anaerolineales bacterium]
MGNTLAVDLASRRYGDMGFAFLQAGQAAPLFPTPAELGLQDPPEAPALAQALNQFAQARGVTSILLDGSQGWRHPSSPIEYMRLCERVVNTPGKTGVPGTTRPGTYLSYVTFSIDVFAHLRSSGWSLLTHDWADKRRQRWVVEVFPSVAWSLLGMDRLPSKSKVGKKLAPWRKRLSRATGYALPAKLTHDQLQAAIVLPLGTSLSERRRDLVLLAGVDPIIEDDIVYEGLIASPRLSP